MKMAICETHASSVKKRKRRLKSKGNTTRGDQATGGSHATRGGRRGCDPAEDNPSTENNVSQESQSEICINMEPEMEQSHSTPSSHVETKKMRKRKRRLEKKRSLKLAKKSLESPTDKKKVSLLSHPHEAETTDHLKKIAIEEVISDAHRSKDLEMPEMGQSRLEVNLLKEKNEQKHNTLKCGEVSGTSILTTLNVNVVLKEEEMTSTSPNGDFCSVDEKDNSLIPKDPETVDHSTPSSHVETKKMRKRQRQREKRRSLKSAKKSSESPTEDRKKLSLLSHPHEAETTGQLKHFAKEDVMNETLVEESIDCSISEKTELSSNTKESSMVIADAHRPKDFEHTLMTKKDDDCLETEECLAQSSSDYTPGQTKRKRKKGRRKRELVDTLEGSLNSDVEDDKKNAKSNFSNEVDATSLHEHSTTNDLVKQKVPHLFTCDATNDNVGAVLEKNSSSRASSSSNERDATGFLKKKLLILDVNGLLVDFVPYQPDGYTPDFVISRKSVFKRPFCDDFLQFCFERFEVGIWSSRTRKNLNMLVEFLMKDSRDKLLFCWDQSHCTTTRFTTVENNEKPLVLKELKKIWETLEPNLPWKKGEYNASNTLLLDDSPYKALRNPAYTAVFPTTYQFKDSDDTSLGPGGDLRTYLEGVSTAENVQKYVKQNPFGQRPISESNTSWRYYLKVINSVK